MGQHSERQYPQSDQEPQIHAPGDVGYAGEALAEDVGYAGEASVAGEAVAAGPGADADAPPQPAALDAAEYADAEDEDTGAVAGDVQDEADAEWDARDADAVAWDAGGEDAVGGDAGETAGGAVPAPGEPVRRPATGEPRVDAALARLDELAGRPVTEHRAIFEDVHRRLRDVLGELDTREQNSGDQPAASGAERRAGR